MLLCDICGGPSSVLVTCHLCGANVCESCTAGGDQSICAECEREEAQDADA